MSKSYVRRVCPMSKSYVRRVCPRVSPMYVEYVL